MMEASQLLRLLEMVEATPPLLTAVVHPVDALSLTGAIEGARRGLVEPVLTQAVREYGYARGVFPRVMLARMPAGGVIHPHIDANPAAKWPHKIHVPITTNPQVTSFFGEQTHHFPAGEAVEVNNLGPHWVRNGGDTDRIHLIFEYYDADQPEPGWLAPLLTAGAAR